MRKARISALTWLFAKQALQKMDKQQLFVFMHITPLTWTKNGIDCAELVEYFTDSKT